jgi:hypothetical protein
VSETARSGPDRPIHRSSKSRSHHAAPSAPARCDRRSVQSSHGTAKARRRLQRLALLWRLRLAAIPADELDRAPGEAYTPREMAFCAVGSTYYADAVGALGAAGAPAAR